MNQKEEDVKLHAELWYYNSGEMVREGLTKMSLE